MKRIQMAALAAATFAAPFALASPALAADPPAYQSDRDGRDWRNDDDRRDDRGEWRDGDRRGDRDDRGEWRDGDRRNDRADDRGDNRNERAHRRGDNRNDRAYDRGDNRRDHANRWDGRRHNGYTREGRWYYGPPPAQWRDHVRYDYRQWRRGERVPSYYRQNARRVDYRREHLRAPPRGYDYYRDDRGDTLLVGIATGVILAVILSQ